jgi:hypothetical protein
VAKWRGLDIGVWQWVPRFPSARRCSWLASLHPPLLLLAIDRWVILDWPRLSEIGQAYDAASALLAGVAVVGVAISLLMQLRQIRISQVQAARMMHMELMRMLTSDPLLRLTSSSAVDVSEQSGARTSTRTCSSST